MSDQSDQKDEISRRRALKIIGVGVAAAGSLPVLEIGALGQHRHGAAVQGQTAGQSAARPAAPKFFTPQELALVTTISDMIIPTDAHSPGAQAAGVPAFIDLMVSESSQETKTLWRDGLAAVERLSREKFSAGFDAATEEQRTKLLTDISKDERKPNAVEERFWVAIKNLTIDGYYTSEIGIHQDLKYQGNNFVKEFKGCTHPEHQA
jgi:hypothetical protein